MKVFDEGLMKFTITKDKVKAEIKISDLAYLLKNSINNYPDNPVRVKRGCSQQFAEALVEWLMDDDPNGDYTRWGKPFEDIFDEWFSGDEDFLKYPDNF
ncbi:MAG: hypothetical protein IJ797_09750 [Selenomonadaceae bacterium]|nr:hypothetical protein [Selenomonadaceae bacterium]